MKVQTENWTIFFGVGSLSIFKNRQMPTVERIGVDNDLKIIWKITKELWIIVFYCCCILFFWQQTNTNLKQTATMSHDYEKDFGIESDR